MTVIAAFTDGHTAALAFDSYTSHTQNTAIVNLTKTPIVRDLTSPRGKPRGRLVIASAGPMRLLQELHQWAPPPRRKATPAADYMLDVAASPQERLGTGSPADRYVADPPGSILDGEFVAIVDASVFVIGPCFTVLEPSTGFITTGSGCEVALGAMAALEDHLAPADVVRRAVEIAGEHCTGVLAPFHVETTTA